jgi:hypothetical protein
MRRRASAWCTAIAQFVLRLRIHSARGARWARMRTHVIKSEMLVQFGASSKLNAEWDFVSMLSTEGRRAASECLDAHIDDLSKRSMSRFMRGTRGISN